MAADAPALALARSAQDLQVRRLAALEDAPPPVPAAA